MFLRHKFCILSCTYIIQFFYIYNTQYLIKSKCFLDLHIPKRFLVAVSSLVLTLTNFKDIKLQKSSYKKELINILDNLILQLLDVRYSYHCFKQIYLCFFYCLYLVVKKVLFQCQLKRGILLLCNLFCSSLRKKSVKRVHYKKYKTIIIDV